jgi:hypothetical protein
MMTQLFDARILLVIFLTALAIHGCGRLSGPLDRADTATIQFYDTVARNGDVRNQR